MNDAWLAMLTVLERAHVDRQTEKKEDGERRRKRERERKRNHTKEKTRSS